MTERIDEYMQKQSCANICCIDNTGLPYCFTCFYAYNSNEKLLYYKSSSDTRHSKIILSNPVVAGSILPDKPNKLHLKGMQFEGMAVSFDDPLTINAATYYYRINPAAVAIPGEIRTIQINSLRLTDSRLGFGKKLTWHREEQEVVL